MQRTGSFVTVVSLDPYSAPKGEERWSTNEPSARRLQFLVQGCPCQQQSWALDPGRTDAKALVSQDTI